MQRAKAGAGASPGVSDLKIAKKERILRVLTRLNDRDTQRPAAEDLLAIISVSAPKRMHGLQRALHARIGRMHAPRDPQPLLDGMDVAHGRMELTRPLLFPGALSSAHRTWTERA
jgi:hypothetical protein